jgi:hypothetical protein
MTGKYNSTKTLILQQNFLVGATSEILRGCDKENKGLIGVSPSNFRL